MTHTDAALRLPARRRVTTARFSYSIETYIAQGGSGVVYRARCHGTDAQVAIKFFLPIYQLDLDLFGSSRTQQSSLRELEKLHSKEVECLKELSHPNIVRVIDNGLYEPKKGDLVTQLRALDHISFFVAEYVPGTNLEKSIQDKPRPKAAIVAILLKICEALAYLHNDRQYMHSDIRPENILVHDQSDEPILIDFALYKNLNFNEVSGQEITKLMGDWDLFPKNLPTNDPLKKIKETSATRQDLKKQCFPGLDLFQFGKLLARLQPILHPMFSDEENDYFNLLIHKLSWPSANSLTAHWLWEQLTKMHPTYFQYMGVEELAPPSSAKDTVQLPGKVVAMSPLMNQLVCTGSFQRLRSINQLAFVSLLYPGATHRRYLHSIRTYSCCADLLESLAHSPVFRLLFSPSLARQALAVSLLHDINHFPLLHVFQELRDIDALHSLDILDLFCDGRATHDRPSIYDILQDIGIDKGTFKDLLFSSHRFLVSNGYDPGLQVVKSLVDSGADVDKLAYLEEDSAFTGVAYGKGIDLARLIASATIVPVSDKQSRNESWHLGFREDGLSAVESLVMARYWMFRTVYWHRANRAVIAMLLHIIRKIYVQEKADVRQYIVDTMWKTDESALDYLNANYRKHFGEDSIAQFMLRQPSSIYQRLVSIRGASSDHEEELYHSIAAMQYDKLESYRSRLTERLGEYLGPATGNDLKLTDADVLIDIPGRSLDTAGPILIEMDNGEVRRIDTIPGPVQTVLTRFEQLAKRLRVFVSPRVADRLNKQILIDNRSELVKAVEESIPDSKPSQVK